jgi:hypothetical protein
VIILDEITTGRGFCFEQLTAEELEFARGVISAQYLQRIAQFQPELVPLAHERGIADYHTLPITFDHARSWSKTLGCSTRNMSRIFPALDFSAASASERAEALRQAKALQADYALA